MKLYFSPLACSLATRISLYEAGIDIDYIEVDPKSKLTSDGSDFRKVNPLGLVPALLTDDGTVITENAAVLQYVADRFPEANLAPRDGLARTQLHTWLCFIGTELHKSLYVPLLDKHAPDVVKSYALAKAETRLSWVNQQLEGREFLLDRFGIADAYLFTILNWSLVAPIKLEPWPNIVAFMAKARARPSVQRAFAEEKELYMKELARHAAA